MTFLIVEPLPLDGLASEVVLHVRSHLRQRVRRRVPTIAEDLAHLFGFPRSDGAADDWRTAASSGDPFQAGAAVAAGRRPNKDTFIVPLGHDDEHLAACRAWLEERKLSDDAFAEIRTADLATLLELSKARDLANATARVDGRERRLPILILGETGSGKELLAKAIHHLSPGKRGVFEVLHVAGMSVDMLNDELFGHVKGAFTGADRGRLGRLEQADGGTLLIDEVGDLPKEAQLRLLRFLQDHSLSRQGDNEVRHPDVRIIAATWHDLEAPSANVIRTSRRPAITLRGHDWQAAHGTHRIQES